jgi:hypothetical protein
MMVFTPRLLLAALLFFGSEVLAWTNPLGHSLLDWLILIPGYLILASILLDLTVRYRVRDLFGGLVLAGIYALLYALLLNPAYAFTDTARTLVTRVMGAQGLISAEMLGLFLLLTGGLGRRAHRLLLVGCLIVGLAWGIWVRWWPPDEGLEQVSLVTMLAYGVGGLALIAALLAYAAPRTAALTPDFMRLSRVGWGACVLLLVAVFVFRLLQGAIDTTALVLTPLILLICWAILWYRERAKGRSLLDGHIPIQAPPPLKWLLPLVVFFAAAILTYNLPLIQVEQANQLTLIGVGFTAYGLAWLPTVSLVLGARGYLKQMSQRQL